MATFFDEDLNKDVEEETSNVNEIDQQDSTEDTQVENVQQANVDQEQEQTPEDDIPEKYRGKSAKEIARMHMEAEKALGRQGSEVGELRRLVDDFIKAQTVTTNKQQAPEDDVDDVDFFADPKKAISKAIEKHPKIREAEQYNQQMKAASSLAQLNAKHPDYKEIVSDPTFAEWIKASRVRQELYVRADAGFDVSAADELLSTWKERKQIVGQTQQLAQAERKQAVKAASTGSAKGSSEARSSKTYRRSDIIDLMVRDPERYAALSDEIMLAYQQGRVR